MKINIVCVGKIKEKFYQSAVAEYVKRLSRYHSVEIVEVAEEKISKQINSAEIAKVQVKESARLEQFLKGHIIMLDIEGKNMDSLEFAKTLKNISTGSFVVTFVIGGSYGVSASLKEKANMLLSFSKLTFPHQLMRVILCEQIYRATTILNNITYHK